MGSSPQETPSWANAAGAVCTAVDALAKVPMPDLTDAELTAALEHAAVQAARLHAVAVNVISEADTRAAWRIQGSSSLRGWVRRCVQLADDAARLVTTARMRAFMPRMAALFAAGQVSLAQMGTAARQIHRLPDMPAWPDPATAADPGRGEPTGDCAPPVDAQSPQTPRWGDLRTAADEILAEHATIADARTLAAIGEQILAAADPYEHLTEALSCHDRRHLSIARGFEGMGEVTGRLDPEAAERAITVLAALARKAGPHDDRTAGQRRADALDVLCKAWLESGKLPLPGHPAPGRDQVLVTIPYPTLAGLPGAPSAVLGSGTPIPAETARRLACGASVRRLITAPPYQHPHGQHPDGQHSHDQHSDTPPGATARLATILRAAIAALPPPLGSRSAVLDAGRSTPTFTAPMRDALHTEYGGRCAFPQCDQPATVCHHIVHWASGGSTSVANGAPLCGYHHYLVHEGGWGLGKDLHGRITAVPPPPGWPGQRKYWRNGHPFGGPPP